MNISINSDLAKVVDKEIKEKKYANRSEFFRDLIRRCYVVRIPLNMENLKFADTDMDHYKILDKSLEFWKDDADDNIFDIKN